MIDLIPIATESEPNDGPTLLSSIILTGAGNAPALRIIERSFASSMVEEPPNDICVFPEGILSSTTGADITIPSSTNAILLPTLEPVIEAHVLLACLVITRSTFTPNGLFCVPVPALASSIASPLSTASVSI